MTFYDKKCLIDSARKQKRFTRVPRPVILQNPENASRAPQWLVDYRARFPLLLPDFGVHLPDIQQVNHQLL